MTHSLERLGIRVEVGAASTAKYSYALGVIDVERSEGVWWVESKG